MKSKAQQLLDNLEPNEFAIVEAWAWPHGLPDNDMNFERILTTVPRPLTLGGLNATAQGLLVEAQAAQAAYKTWLATVPPGFKNPNGDLTPENQNVVLGILDMQYGSKITVENLNAAFTLAKNNRQLRWTSVQTPKTSVQGSREQTLGQAGVQAITGVINHHETSTNVADAEAWVAWVAQAPEGLKNKDGRIDVGNYERASEIITNELGGRVTVHNIDAAIRLLSARKQLVWFSQPESADARANRLLVSDEIARQTKDLGNLKKTEKQDIAEAEAEARKQVSLIFKNADRLTQERIRKIVDTHLKFKASPIVTKLEVKDMIQSYVYHAYPPGQTHTERDEARENILRIMREQHEGNMHQPEAAVATWRKIRTAIEHDVLNGEHGQYERSVR